MNNNRIKVLHIIKSLGRGGAEMLLPETLKLHDQSKFEFHYIYFLPWKNQLVETIAQAGGKVTCLSANNNVMMLTRIRALVGYVRKNKIDLIHAHLPWAGIVARTVKKLTGVPVLYTEHNKQERYHRGTRAMNLLTMNWLSTVIAVSDDVNESIRKHKRNLKVPLRTILNGVDPHSFRKGAVQSRVREELKIKPDEVVIGTIAVFRFQKRLDLWLEIASRLLKDNEHIRFIVVGDGPLKNELHTKSQQLGVTDKVHFVGLQQEVRPYLEAMDIYFMSSIFEGLPIALLEAMSYGLPVVTTDAGGIKQVVTDGREGRMCAVEETGKLAPMLEELIQSDTKRKQMGINARLKIQQGFSMDRMVTELENLYKSTLGIQ